MSVHDAEPEDIYVDEHGKLWRVVGRWDEPAVTVEEVEPQAGQPKQRQTGGVSGHMWMGFKRIFRKPEPSQDDQQRWSKRYDELLARPVSDYDPFKW